MPPTSPQDALALWLAQQQPSGSLAPSQRPTELHLHQHHYYASQEPVKPVERAESDRYADRYADARARAGVVSILPLVYIFVGAVSLAVVLATLAAVIEGLNRPSVQYVQPSRGG